jgi:LysM repeat protein
VGVMMMLTLLGLWWDSSPQGVSPKALVAKLFIHATHSYLTEWAIDKLKGQWPEIEQYRKKIIEGANTEMHADDENAQGTKYGINLPDKAKKRGGNNAGCSNPKGYWDDCLDAYRAGEKEKAYFLLGILLHMIQDMGVPAHACGEYHEGRIWNRKWDNFEAMGTFNWKPSFDNIPPEQENPEPSDYYAVSKDLTLQDVCDFLEIKRVKGKEPPPRWDINAFSKTWLFANHRETALLSRRQGCTCHVTMWALKSAARALAKTAKGGDTTAGPKPAQPPATTARRVYPVPPITWHQPATAAAGKRIHLVKKGDTLWGIAKTYYGDGRKWSRIYGANKAVIGVNPNKIYPGQKLEIP